MKPGRIKSKLEYKCDMCGKNELVDSEEGVLAFVAGRARKNLDDSVDLESLVADRKGFTVALCRSCYGKLVAPLEILQGESGRKTVRVRIQKDYAYEPHIEPKPVTVPVPFTLPNTSGPHWSYHPPSYTCPDLACGCRATTGGLRLSDGV